MSYNLLHSVLSSCFICFVNNSGDGQGDDNERKHATVGRLMNIGENELLQSV